MIVRNAKGEIVEGGEVSPTDTEHGRRGGRGEGRGRGGRRREGGGRGGGGEGGDRRGQEGMGGEGGDGRSLYAESTVECGSSFVYL